MISASEEADSRDGARKAGPPKGKGGRRLCPGRGAGRALAADGPDILRQKNRNPSTGIPVNKVRDLDA